ncbi:MAG: acyl carrier protein [Anaerolineales bacterium]
MEKVEFVETVRALLAEAFDLPEEAIPADLAFGGVKQWDSMGHMGVMLLLEERFGVPIDADLIATLTSVPAICDYLSKTRGKA